MTAGGGTGRRKKEHSFATRESSLPCRTAVAGENQHPSCCSTKLPADRKEPAASPALWSLTQCENQELKQQKRLFALISEILHGLTHTALLKGY